MFFVNELLQCFSIQKICPYLLLKVMTKTSAERQGSIGKGKISKVKVPRKRTKYSIEKLSETKIYFWKIIKRREATKLRLQKHALSMKQLLESSLPELSHFLVAIKSPNRAESSKKTARNGVMSESQTKRLILERETTRKRMQY